MFLKRMVSLFLCLVLCLSAVPALGMSVTASTVTVISDDITAMPNSVTAIGDTLYVLFDDDSLCSRPVARDEFTRLNPEAEVGGLNYSDVLFTWNGELYALRRTDVSDNDTTKAGSVRRLLDDTGAYAPTVVEGLTVDVSGLAITEEDGSSALNNLTSFFCEGDWLYYTAMDYSSGMIAVQSGRISLTDGKHQPYTLPTVRALAPVGDGRIAALIFDFAALYSANNLTDVLAQYALLDPEQGTLGTATDLPSEGEFGGYNIGGLCAGGGSVFYLDGSRVRGIDLGTGEVRLSAYTGQGMFGSPDACCLYADGYFVNYSYSGLFVYQLDSASVQNGALTIFGEFGSDTHTAFLKANPDVAVDVSSEYTNDIERLTQAMVSETQTFDVLQLILSAMPVQRLMDKGYCTDLSGDEEIMRIVGEMYPQFVEPLMRDGKLYGVPVDMSANTMAVNKELMKRLGLTEADIPSSYGELLDFAANWVWDYGEDNPDISLFDYAQADQLLYSLLITNYIAWMQKQGEPLKFDTPLFRSLMERYTAIDFKDINTVSDSEDEYWRQDSLFSLAQTTGYFSYTDENLLPLYLAMEDGGEPFIWASTSVLIINPRTKRMDEALRYVRFYAEHLDKASANISLFPDHNDPVESKFFERNLKELQKMIDEKEKALETADPEHRASLQEELDQLKENLAESENYRYTVTAETIAHYREKVVPYLYVMGQSTFANGNNSVTGEVNQLLMQYLAGSLTLDQLTKDLDQRVRLMELEDQ